MTPIGVKIDTKSFFKTTPKGVVLSTATLNTKCHNRESPKGFGVPQLMTDPATDRKFSMPGNEMFAAGGVCCTGCGQVAKASRKISFPTGVLHEYKCHACKLIMETWEDFRRSREVRPYGRR